MADGRSMLHSQLSALTITSLQWIDSVHFYEIYFSAESDKSNTVNGGDISRFVGNNVKGQHQEYKILREFVNEQRNE